MKSGELLEGRFELREMLGEGGMGQVRKAWDRELERSVAIKMLLPQLSSDPLAMREMKREVKLSQQLSHPNIVSVYDYRVHERTPYIVMEFVEGRPLNHFLFDLPGTRLQEAEFLQFASDILGAVGYAHQRGVIHRDLKPGNIMVMPDRQLKLMDFGIAAAMKATYTRLSSMTSALTVQYSSPEQINGENPAPSMDIYSLGCVFYEMLSGRPPFFQGDVIHQQLNRQPAPLVHVSTSVNQAIMSCLIKDPERRIQSVEEIRGAFAGSKTVRLAGKGNPKRSRDPKPGIAGRVLAARRVVATVLLIVAGLLAGWGIARFRRPSTLEARAGTSRPIEPQSAPLVTDAPASALDRSGLALLIPRAMSEGQWEGARLAIEQFRRVAPDDGRAEEWEKRLTRLEHESRERDRLRAQASTLIRARNWPAAQKAVEDLLTLVPSDKQAQSWLRMLHEGKTEDLQARSRQERDERIQGLQAAISGALAAGKLENAETGIEELLGLVPRDEQIAGWKRQIAERRETQRAAAIREAAIAELRAAIRQHLQAQHWDEAEVKIKELMRGAPDDPQAKEWLRQAGEARSAEQRASAARAAEEERQKRDRREAEKALTQIEFVQISAGEFRRSLDKRQFRVRISEPFEIAKYEVTQAQWTAVMGNNPSKFRGATLPVENVTWHEVQAFLRRLNERHDGYQYSLPTEAQWEYAARAGKEGDLVLLKETDAWYADNSGSTSHPVGQKRPNRWGLYDMLGNVEEWCQDAYDPKYYARSPETDPPGPQATGYQSIRGGSWSDYPQALQYSRSQGRTPMDKASFLGFRCVRRRVQ